MPDDTYSSNQYVNTDPDTTSVLYPNASSFWNDLASGITAVVNGVATAIAAGGTAVFNSPSDASNFLQTLLPPGVPVDVPYGTIDPTLGLAGFSPGTETPGPDDGFALNPNDADSPDLQGTVIPAGPRVKILQSYTSPPVATDKAGHISTDVSINQFTTNDPVNAFTGAFLIRDVDVTIPGGAWDLVLVRVYDSLAQFAGPFGWNWDHNHNQFIHEIEIPTGATPLYGRWMGTLHEDVFIWNSTSGLGDPPSGVFDLFEKPTSDPHATYRITKPGGIVYRYKTIDSRNARRILLDTITDSFGNVLEYGYNSDSQLTSVTDQLSGRSLQFTYGNCGLLEGMTDDYGRQWEYHHDPNIEHLVLVKYPPTLDYSDGISKQYQYTNDPLGDIRISHSITVVTDGDGNPFIQNQYDDDPSSPFFGRVIAQISGDQAYQYEYLSIQFVPQNRTLCTQQTLVTSLQMPDGGVRSYTFNYRGDVVEARMRMVQDGTFQVLTTKYEYNPSGTLLRTIFPPKAGSHVALEFGYDDDPAHDIRLHGRVTSVKLFQDYPINPNFLMLWEGEYETGHQLLQNSYDMRPNNSEVPAIKNQFKTSYSYDGNGFLTGITLPPALQPDGTTSVPGSITQTVSTSVPGSIGSVTTAEGKLTTFNYGSTFEANARLTSIVGDPSTLNAIEGIAYSTSTTPSAKNFGLPISSSDPTSVQRQFVFNSMGRVEQINLPSVAGLTGQVKFHYDADGFIVGVEAPKGNFSVADSYIATSIDRDLHREITAITVGSNTTTPYFNTSVVNYQGLPVNQSDASGRFVQRIFDERGLLIVEQLVGQSNIHSNEIHRQYDSIGNLTAIFDAGPNGTSTPFNTTDLTYDVYLRLSTVVDSLGNYSAYTYGWVTTITDAHDANYGVELNNPLIQIDAKDSGGNILARTIREFDKRGRLIQVRVAEFTGTLPGTVDYLAIQFYLDGDNRLTKVVDPRGSATTYTYDALGRMTKLTDPVGNVRNYTYDLAGRLLTVELVDVNSAYASLVTTYNYADARKRLTSVVTPDGVEFKTEYDDRDLPVTSKLPATFDDSVERELNRSFGVLGEVLQTTFDSPGLNLISIWTYDNTNRLTRFQDPSGSQTNYHYDGLGRQSNVSYPDGSQVNFTYDAHGRLLQKSFGFGTTVQPTYLENGLVQSVAFTTTGPLHAVDTHHYEYDALNRLTHAYVGPSDVHRTYDSLGRMLTEWAPGATVQQTYQTTAGTFHRIFGGRDEKFTLDANGVPTSIDMSGTNLLSITSLNGPDAIDAGTMNAGTISIATKYDEQKRLYELDYTAPSDTETMLYRYDSRQRRRVEVITSSSTGSLNNYALHDSDPHDRLLDTANTGTAIALTGTINTQTDQDNDIITVIANEPSPQILYTYDEADTRRTYTDTSAGSPNNYNSDSGHKFQNSNIENFQYLADGSRSQDGTRTFDVDALGRIVKINDSGSSTTLEIGYDALGRPSTLNDAVNPIRQFYYFGLDLLQERGGTADREYTVHPMLGRIATHTPPGGQFWHLYDIRQNLIATLDSTSNVRELIRYDDFGFPTITSVGMSSGIEPVFGGMRWLDFQGTFGSSPLPNWPGGLYLGMFRIYDESNGVWLSQDPLEYFDGPNMSAYVGQNPVGMIDPMGLGKRDASISNVEPRSIPPVELGDRWKRPPGYMEYQVPIPGIGKVHELLRFAYSHPDVLGSNMEIARKMYPKADIGGILSVASGRWTAPIIGTQKDAFEQLASLQPDTAVVDQLLAKLQEVEFRQKFGVLNQASYGADWDIRANIWAEPGHVFHPLPTVDLIAMFEPVAYVGGVSGVGATILGAQGDLDLRIPAQGSQKGNAYLYAGGSAVGGKSIGGGANIGAEWYFGSNRDQMNANAFSGQTMAFSIPLGLSPFALQFTGSPVNQPGMSGLFFGIRLSYGWSFKTPDYVPSSTGSYGRSELLKQIWGH